MTVLGSHLLHKDRPRRPFMRTMRTKCEAALNHSYNELFLFIRDAFVAKPQMIAMADVSSRLVASMNFLGIVQVKDSTK